MYALADQTSKRKSKSTSAIRRSATERAHDETDSVQQRGNVTHVTQAENTGRNNSTSGRADDVAFYPAAAAAFSENVVNPGAFAVQGQLVEQRTTGLLSPVPYDEQSQLERANQQQQNAGRPPEDTSMVQAEEVATLPDMEERVRIRYQQELDRVTELALRRMNESTPAATAERLDTNNEDSKPAPVHGRRKKWVIPAVVATVILVVVLALVLGLTIRNKNGGNSQPSQVESEQNPTPVPAPVNSTLTPTLVTAEPQSPTVTPSDGFEAPTGQPTGLPTEVFREPWDKVGQDIAGLSRGDNLGRSVSLSTDASILAMGAPATNTASPGYVLVFRFDPSLGVWQRLGSILEGIGQGGEFGKSVSLSRDGSLLAVGAEAYSTENFGAGHVSVYEYNASSETWSKKGQDLFGEEENNKFGYVVSLSGNGKILAAGSHQTPTGDGLGLGVVRFYGYQEESSTWEQLGQDVLAKGSATLAGDFTDRNVFLSENGTIAAIGVDDYDSAGINSGRVLVYSFDGARWIQMGQNIDGVRRGDGFGNSVSLSADGTILAAGAWFYDSSQGVNAVGHVRVFHYDATTSAWVPLGQAIEGNEPEEWLASSVHLSDDGTILAAGATGNDQNSKDAGNVRVYGYNSTSLLWTQIGQTIYGDSITNWFGYSLSLSGNGDVVAVGSYGNGDDASGLVSVFAFGQ